MKPLTVFLFGQAHRAHWKLSLNKVVGILNPKIMEDRQSGNQNKGKYVNFLCLVVLCICGQRAYPFVPAI